MTARSAYVTSYLESRRIPFSDVGKAFVIDSVRVNGVTPHNSLPYLTKQQKENVILVSIRFKLRPLKHYKKNIYKGNLSQNMKINRTLRSLLGSKFELNISKTLEVI